eukprot:CAMPEP_0116998334 /NCGR_PEP_ID=MMETSP0472-20121206/1440_1 /TAXON_ID=693140 ORGANISM="Tiarina fusus, Strain LIS" /NCGR_SAMPLE_ID=MMETSP0472 /ASSEMBLY_ACC=CAM_ASM_000603 /LENGTH=147 /DNA_ID=CAMNT_0004697451 /DNA_START=133 /DNA_END=573 /DNA_ORIENTATION=+
MTSSIITLQDRINVETTDGSEIGSFFLKIIDRKEVFILEDVHETDIATATKTSLSWGATYDIQSEFIEDKWTIHERILSSAIHMENIFTINKNGQQIAKMQQAEILRDVIELTEPGKGVCATMKKAWFGIRDSWYISVDEKSEVAPW